jgi:hypothetical protein
LLVPFWKPTNHDFDEATRIDTESEKFV